MKRIFVSLLLVFTTLSFAQGFESPDILVYSKLDYDWSNILIAKFRRLFKNYDMLDPMSGKINGEFQLNESKIGDLLPQNSKTFIRDFGNAIGLNIVQGETKILLKDFSYDVKGFRTDLKASEQKSEGFLLGLDFSASEVSLSAEKLSFTIVIPGKNSQPILNVDIIRPVIHASKERLIDFYAKLRILNNPDHYKIQIKDANFDKMANGLIRNKEEIYLGYDDIVIPKVSIKIGSKTVNFSQQKIEDLIRSKHSEIKGILIAQAGNMLRSNTMDTLYATLEKFKIPKDWWFPPAKPFMQSNLTVNGISSSASDRVGISLDGDFCTLDLADKYGKECIKHKVTNIAPSRITPEMHKKSLAEMNEIIDQDGASIVASVSENYLNKLIVTTYDAGLWKDSLDEAGVTLGPSRVILRINKKGDTALLIMDVIYKPTKIERALIGSKEVRFPLVLEVGLRIEMRDKIPAFVVKVHDIDTSDETIINGLPKEKMESTVKNIPRFKKKVAKTIRDRVSSLRNKDMLQLVIRELEGVGLEKIELETDGQGRMTGNLSLSDFPDEEPNR